MIKQYLRKSLVCIATAGLVSGCAINPKPVTQEERVARAAADLEALFAGQEAVTGGITLAEAMARAIKYNLDHRVKLMEEAVTQAEAKVARMDMLPDLAVAAGYTTRSNVAASSSQSVITGLESLEPSTSQERTRQLADATMVWNILDFGVSYVTAKQRADRTLIASEKRRKAIQNIIQDVRVAYWQALSAARLATETDELLMLTRSALDRSRQLQEQGLQPPMAAMQYQEGLLSTLRSLLHLRQQLSTSRTELASLMNIRPGDKFQLTPSDAEVEAPEVNTELAELEDFGLLHRPELIEEDLRVRVASADVKKAMLRMLPGLEIDLGAHYDSNKFLVNNDWSVAGVRISWNLFNLISGPAQQRRAEAQLEVDKTRRLATSMAVLTQVHVGYQRYLLAQKDFELANVLQQVKEDIAQEERTRRQVAVSDEFTEIRARLDALVAKLQRDQALAELQNSVGRIHNSIGLDPLPPEVSGYDIVTLAAAIEDHQVALKDMLVQPQMDPDAYDRIAAVVKYERAVSDKQAAVAALTEAEEMRAERERLAAVAREDALAVQRLAIEAALLEADGNRAAAQRAAEEAVRLAEEQAAAEAAREAAALAAEQAAAAQERAEAAQRAAEEAQHLAEQAAAERAAQAERLAAEVQAKIDAAVDAAVMAGAAQNQVDEATKAAQEAKERADSIEIPEAPEGTSQSSGLDQKRSKHLEGIDVHNNPGALAEEPAATPPARDPAVSGGDATPPVLGVAAPQADLAPQTWREHVPAALVMESEHRKLYETVTMPSALTLPPAVAKRFTLDTSLSHGEPVNTVLRSTPGTDPGELVQPVPLSFVDKDPFTDEPLIK
jgi:outer membrane protein TolC